MISFGRMPKNKKFDYTPRHYDPDKEKREQRRNPKLGKGSFSGNRRNMLLQNDLDKEYFDKGNVRKGQMVRIVLLIGLLTNVLTYFFGLMPWYFALGIGLILLLLLSNNLKKSVK